MIACWVVWKLTFVSEIIWLKTLRCNVDFNCVCTITSLSLPLPSSPPSLSPSPPLSSQHYRTQSLKKTQGSVFDSPRAMGKLLKEAKRVKQVLSANTDHFAQVYIYIQSSTGLGYCNGVLVCVCVQCIWHVNSRA